MEGKKKPTGPQNPRHVTHLDEVIDQPLNHDRCSETQNRVDHAEEHRLHQPPVNVADAAENPSEPVRWVLSEEIPAGV